jgi:hypothetical protein
MKFLKPFVLMLLLTPLLNLGISGCSERSQSTIKDADSTIIYPSKEPNGIEAKIILCRKQDKKTATHIQPGTAFAISENESVFAFIELENVFIRSERKLMFHIDWIGPDGKSVFLKRIDLSSTDSTTTISSSISVSPEKRQAGDYILKVYLFRELIAEKQFKLVDENQARDLLPGAIISKIAFFGIKDKKNGQLIASDSIFTLGEKERIYACIDLVNHRTYADGELKFKLDWIGPDGKSFFKKLIDLSLTDSCSQLISSISISPKNRQAGKCFLRVSLFDELIIEQPFVLRPEFKPLVNLENKLIFTIAFYSKADPKSEILSGPDSVFVMSKNAKVYAIVDAVDLFESGKKEFKFRLDWIGPNGKSFYGKQISISSADSSTSIQSAISIDPEKRQSGSYFVRLSLDGKQVGLKKFEIIRDTVDGSEN